MKVTVQQHSPDPANTLLDVYKDGENRPCCTIYEEDFIELLSDSEYERFTEEKIEFNVNATQLFVKCKLGFALH